MKEIQMPKAGIPVNEYGPIIRELVKAVNAWNNVTLSPQGIGTVKIAEGNVKIVFITEECGS